VAVQSDFTAGLLCNLAVRRIYLPSNGRSKPNFVLRALQTVWLNLGGPKLSKHCIEKSPESL